MLHVKVKGHFLVDGRVLVNPGSVVGLDDDTAKQFVKRGMGELHPGPVYHAPAAPRAAKGAPAPEPVAEEEATAEVERQDLGSRLAIAERAVAKRQGKQAGAL